MSAKASEIKLMERIASGENVAFAQLYTSTSQQLHQYLIRVLGDRKKSDNVLVTTYQDAWRLAGQYNQGLTPIKWLIVLARKSAVVDPTDSNATNLSESGAYDVAVLDRQKVFASVMASLPVQIREPLALVLLSGYTYHAMAEILGSNIDAVKNDVFDAKQALKDALKAFGIKKHDVSQSNILRELIPLYINGALAGKHKKAFEKSLKNDQCLKQEYLEFYEIEAYFDQFEVVSPQHLEQLFSKIKNAIDDLVEEKELPQKPPPSVELASDFLHRALSSARIGWGLAILQFAILAVVLIVVVPKYSNQVQAKLSSTQLLQQAKGKKINVVFQDSATQQQIRDLLLNINGQMYSGPTDIGLYTITVVASDEILNQMLDALRKSEYIVLAEPAY